MDIDTATNLLLARLDNAYSDMRSVIADMTHLNNQTASFKQAVQNFQDAATDIWEWKQIVHRVRSNSKE
ncbi:MAG: hypothetical protein XU15_C0011G0056 [candidate division NC10 bacterium CSP1-5]|nr:MAG: hypothetical protein XU15_C0011G0056 [candidate division NC10 bacterium CSP1-5]